MFVWPSKNLSIYYFFIIISRIEMGRQLWVCYCFLLFSVLQVLPRCHGCWEEERLALLRLKPFFPSLPTNWDNGSHSNCCHWDSVLCDPATGVVTLLDLTCSRGPSADSYYLNASLFLPFKHLTTLYLWGNSIAGCVENQGFERLSALRFLNDLFLDFNDFDNGVLTSLQHISSLKSLSLAENRLNESLSIQGKSIEQNNLSGRWFNFSCKYHPFTNCKVSFYLLLDYCQTELNNLKGLIYLDLGYNSIESFQPTKGAKVLNLPNLVSLYLHSNYFNNNVFSFLRELSSLEVLFLNDNKLKGSIYLREFNALNNLEELTLGKNQIEKIVASKAGKGLEKLNILDLSNVSAQGSILLQSIGLFPSLKTLYLYDNTFDGSITGKEMDALTKLEELVLSGSYIQANFLHVIEALTSLQVLTMSRCSIASHQKLDDLCQLTKLRILHFTSSGLSGNLPSCFSNLTSLQTLDISDNQVAGSIPSFFGNMTSLRYLVLSNNKLSGEIPEQLAMGSSLLESLILSNNNLQGQIFHDNSNLTNLKVLLLDGNNFSGRIQNGLSKCSVLSTLDVSDNNLFGGIPPWIANITSLREIIMPNNALEGPLPLDLFNLPNLQVLDLSTNLISGTIPSSINLSQINHIHLSKNKLKGTLPNTLCNSPQLITLDLSNNHLIGTIPKCIEKLYELSYLILKNNSFKGQIPLEICQLTKLSVIDLSYNDLFGSFPPCLNITTRDDPFTYGSVNMSLYENAPIALTIEPIEFQTKSMSYSYKGQILTFLSGIDLSRNKFTGEIPKEIGNLYKICVLNLSHNRLTGGIPFTISKLRRIESLDLSFNNLRGRIPPQIVDLTFLSSFNVSFNNLSGPTPKRVNQFATFEETSYMDNPFLCGEPLSTSCKVAKPALANPKATIGETEDGTFMDMDIFYFSFIASYVTSLLAVIVIFWINPYWRRKWFYYLETTTTSFYYYVMDHLPKCF